MHTIQKIAVIGGTGKAGQYLIPALLTEGYTIQLLLRNPSAHNFTDDRIKIIPDDARNSQAILLTLKGCDAVISMLGQPRGETAIFSAATNNVLQAMKETGIQRYIVITGLSVDAPGDHKNEKAEQATAWMKAHYPETTLDKQREYELLCDSNMDWTLIRLPLIVQTDETPEIIINLHDCPGEAISAASLARFAVQQLRDDTYVRRSPFIANSEG
jgi:nucleoside-diphosphate-sugar epimerase